MGNYPTGTAIPGALSAYLAIAATALPTATIYFGSELPPYANTLLFQVTEIEGDQAWAEIGPRYRREETFQFTSLISYAQGGPQDVLNGSSVFASILQAVASNFVALSTACAQDPTLGGVVRVSEVGNFVIKTGTDQNGLNAVTYAFALRCVQRVESLS